MYRPSPRSWRPPPAARATWRGTGGMATKLHAARLCLESGIDMVIANGNNMEAVYGIVAGQDVGTRFSARRK